MKYFDTDVDLKFVLTDKTDIVMKEHNHVSKYIVGLLLNGSLKIVKKNETFECTKDDIFIIPIYVVHSIQAINDDTRFLSMCVGEAFINDYLNSIAQDLLSKYTDKLCQQGVISEENATAFIDAMDIVAELYCNYKNIPKTEIDQISKSIVEKPENKIEISKLADDIFISKYYFIRKFKKEIGLTPYRFYIQNRIRKAQTLLASKRSIAEVALEVGFYDQSHFIKAFKSVLGITPSEYISSLEHLD